MEHDPTQRYHLVWAATNTRMSQIIRLPADLHSLCLHHVVHRSLHVPQPHRCTMTAVYGDSAGPKLRWRSIQRQRWPQAPLAQCMHA
jgi:hypothetical protein